MFGYIRPFKPEMKIKEFDVYKGVYCGLCKQLGHSYGVLSRFTLSYDFAFLALIAMGENKQKACFKTCRCFAGPFKKKLCACSDPSLRFAADCAVIMLYYKLRDSLADRGFFEKTGAILFFPFCFFAYKKAKKNLPEIDRIVAKTTADQALLERASCESIDAAAQPTALALSGIFSSLSDDEERRNLLGRFGYLLGRWVYLIDALDDLESDIKKKNYNPFAQMFKINSSNMHTIEKTTDEIKGIINMTTGEIANCYVSLGDTQYKDIIDNIIYLGLPQTLYTILKGDPK